MNGLLKYSYSLFMLIFLIACSNTDKEDLYEDDIYFTVSESGETKGATGIISGLGTYKTGKSITVKAKTGALITGERTRGSGSFGSTYESGGYACADINDIHGDWKVSAHLPDYTVTVKAGTGGTASGGGVVEKGSSVGISASPSSGYSFSKWTLTSGTGSFGNSSSASTSFKPNSNCTVTANFQAKVTQKYTVTCSIEYSWSGGENPAYRCVVGSGLEKNVSYPNNKSCTFTNVSSGDILDCCIYAGGQTNFKGWYVNGSYLHKGQELSISVSGNTTVVAKW